MTAVKRKRMTCAEHTNRRRALCHTQAAPQTRRGIFVLPSGNDILNYPLSGGDHRLPSCGHGQL